MKKLVACIFVSLLFINSTYAASVPRRLKASIVHQAPLITQTYYTCGWRCQCAMKKIVKALNRYRVKTIIYPYQIRVIAPDYMLFETLSAELKPPFARLIIKDIADLIKHFPYAKIDIYGYDDNIGLPDSLTKLTLKRAETIAGKLWVEDIPLKSQTLHYYGRGEHFPIADNDTVLRMGDNRRIEVWVRLPH